MLQRTAHQYTDALRTKNEVWLGVQERAEREARHRVTDLARPKFGVGADGSQRSANLGRAAREDQNMREQWGYRLKSAYVRRLDIPDVVGPGDVQQARAILGRIEVALDIRGDSQWTESERGRLRRMRDEWAVRAGGRDIIFNTIGWRRKATWVGAAHKEKAEVQRFIACMAEVREVIENG